MTRTDMLNRVGLSEDDFDDLLDKFRQFYGSLTAEQQAVVNRALPNFKQAVGVFGGDITKDDLKALLAPPPPISTGAPVTAPVTGAPAPTGSAGAFGQNGLNQISNGDGDGNGG